MESNILFYSKKCSMCVDLYNILKNEELLQYFKQICIDDNPAQFKGKIQFVPTMIIKGIDKLIEKQDTFVWVDKIRFIRQQNLNKSVVERKNLVNKDGPLEYRESEMSGISDQYAYTKTDDAMPKSFLNMRDTDKNIILTAPSENKKIDKNIQKNLISNLMKTRSDQEELIVKTNQDIHKNIIAQLNKK